MITSRQNRVPAVPPELGAPKDFLTYLHNLNDWEAELLANVQMTYDAFTSMGKMQAGFLAAGDGSVKYEQHGAFGWIISTITGERIVRANGPVRGYRPSSYRAEGYGILSILRFVKRLTLYCDTNPDWKWEMTSDNISLVDTVNGREDDEDTTHWSTPTHNWSIWHEISPHDIEEAPPITWTTSEHSQPNTTLSPDWDVLNKIRWSMEQDGIRGCSFTHIKGHQDRKTPYKELPLRAQLNVDADKLASTYQEAHGQARPIVLMFPHSAVNLQFRDGNENVLPSKDSYTLPHKAASPAWESFVLRPIANTYTPTTQ